ncbi:MAG: hypothetical protein U0354_12810 [Candidatus Sericytochromatia bacterium]
MEELDFIDNNYLKIIREKTCIGKNVWVYKLSKNIDDLLLDFLKQDSNLTYPLGEKYPYFVIQSVGKFVISGIKGENEIKVVPRLTANSEIRKKIEQNLIQFLKD